MPLEAPNRASAARDRLQQFVDKSDRTASQRSLPKLGSGHRAAAAPVAPTYDALDEDDDGPITTRWAVG